MGRSRRDQAKSNDGRRRVGRRSLAVALGGALVTSVLAASPATADVIRLGATADTAALSCWDVKSQNASAVDGSYWLLTPAMSAPQRFYCDMTTDGGGWVLIGRGREGWKFSTNGQGTPDQVQAVVDGPAAFLTKTLSSTVIDDLLNGGRPDQLPDGVRVRRATDTSGSVRQEVRFGLGKRDRWAWAFEANQPLTTWRIGSRTGTGGTSREFGSDQYEQRVQTTERDTHGYTAGWGFGAYIRGSNTSSSYLWSRTTEGNALPFAQVFVRPRLTAANTPFTPVPDAGLPADAQRPLIGNLSAPTAWGVTGSANGLTGELNTEVQGFAQSGNRMIVGGNFRYVQKGAAASGADKIEQSYLAAFDLTTGDWLPDFRPVLNGQIKDLQTLPNGTVVAAGEFTTVNGAPSPGLVALDPTTGAVDPTFRVAMENRVSGQAVAGQALDLEGPWLYLGGRFTHLAGGTRTSPVYARNGARVSVANGTPDSNWNPGFNGTVIDLDASPRGDRAYFAGYFTQANGTSAPQVAVVSTAPGAGLVPGLAAPSFSSTKRYQQVVREVGDRAWHGGSEHMLFSYSRDTFSRLSTNITNKGGDFQAIHDQDGVVYAGCHCGNFNYSGSTTWANTGVDPNWTQADNIRFTGAWDASTGSYIPEFVPGLQAARGHGPWDLTTDSSGTLWMGGDFSKAQTTGERWQWVGGFVRFPERDSVAPTTPGPVTGFDNAGTTTLQWGAATDDRDTATYEILRDDRVIATTWARTISLPTPATSSRYFVRAVDTAGNRSATTRVHQVTPGEVPPPPTTTTAPPVTTTTAPPVTTTTTTVAPPAPDPQASLASWSSDADRFDTATGTAATIETAGTYGERLTWTQQPGEAAYRSWNGTRLGAPRADHSLRWITTLSARPTTSVVLAQGLDDSGPITQRWRLDVVPDGRLRLRNGANTQTAQSTTPLPLGTELRIEAVRTGTTMTVSVFAPVASTTPYLTLTGAVDTNVNHIRIGNTLASATAPTFTVDEIVLTDRAGLIGAP